MKSIFFTLIPLLLSSLAYAQHMGVGVSNPLEKLDVDGAIRLKTTDHLNAGTIRWNPDRNDFEGYNGTAWVSLTGNQGQWGRQENFSMEDDGTYILLEQLENNQGWNFGSALEHDANQLYVGAEHDHLEPNSTDVGRVYVLRKDNNGRWTQHSFAEILPPVPVVGERFGSSLALQNGNLVVGAPGYSDLRGRVLVFTIDPNGDAIYKQAFAAGDGTAFDYFGGELSMDGQFLFVSSPGKTINGHVGQGKVYIYKYNTGTNLWSFSQSLLAPDPGSYSHFGSSTSIFGNRAVVAAPGKNINGNNLQGKVYAYSYIGNTWVLSQQITAPDGELWDEFGYAIELKGDTLFVGAPERDFASLSDRGKVYIYVWSGTQWEYQSTIYPIQPEHGQGFGSSLSYRDGYLLVGAPRYSKGTLASSGIAYLFKRSNGLFMYQTTLASGDADAGDEFGYRIMLTPGCAVVSSPRASMVQSESNGRVYYFYE